MTRTGWNISQGIKYSQMISTQEALEWGYEVQSVPTGPVPPTGGRWPLRERAGQIVFIVFILFSNDEMMISERVLVSYWCRTNCSKVDGFRTHNLLLSCSFGRQKSEMDFSGLSHGAGNTSSLRCTEEPILAFLTSIGSFHPYLGCPYSLPKPAGSLNLSLTDSDTHSPASLSFIVSLWLDWAHIGNPG